MADPSIPRACAPKDRLEPRLREWISGADHRSKAGATEFHSFFDTSASVAETAVRGHWDFCCHILTPTVRAAINEPLEMVALEIGPSARAQALPGSTVSNGSSNSTPRGGPTSRRKRAKSKSRERANRPRPENGDANSAARVVLYDDATVLGHVSDGNIRRAIIRGGKLHSDVHLT